MSDADTNANLGSSAGSLHRLGDRALTRCLSLDLEIGRNDQRIHAFAGVRPDTGQTLVYLDLAAASPQRWTGWTT